VHIAKAVRGHKQADGVTVIFKSARPAKSQSRKTAVELAGRWVFNASVN
jgi:hypothetical protein